MAETTEPDGSSGVFNLRLRPAAIAVHCPDSAARPQAPQLTGGVDWFHISDYSLGYVAGWGIHHIDMAQWGSGNDETGPVEIEGKAVWPKDDAITPTPTK